MSAIEKAWPDRLLERSFGMIRVNKISIYRELVAEPKVVGNGKRLGVWGQSDFFSVRKMELKRPFMVTSVKLNPIDDRLNILKQYPLLLCLLVVCLFCKTETGVHRTLLGVSDVRAIFSGELEFDRF